MSIMQSAVDRQAFRARVGKRLQPVLAELLAELKPRRVPAKALSKELRKWADWLDNTYGVPVAPSRAEGGEK